MISGRKMKKLRTLNKFYTFYTVIEKWVEVKEISLNKIIALDE